MKKINNYSLKQQLKNFRKETVSLSSYELIHAYAYKKDNNETLPLFVEPIVDDIDLIDWIEGNRIFIENNLSKYGAIFFRGFNIDTVSTFERFGLTICSELFNENGEHPRETVSGKVYTPVFYPADRKLLWHNENSFNHRFPLKIMFGCRQPAQQGGETPIVDSRQVFQLIDPKIRERFIEKKVMYVRNYGNNLGLNWETVFQTKNPLEVEANCKKSLIDCEWKSGGRLRTRSIRPSIIKHPKTGELSWFNQIQHWHPSCLDTITRETLLSSFKPEDLPRNCFYGDGTPIEDSVMQEICDLYQKLEVTFAWQKGDLLLLDNILTAHGRNPFLGKRELLVAMGDLASYTVI